MKTCRVCKQKFAPMQSFQTWCCVEHGVILANKKLEKIKKSAKAKECQADREKRDKLKSKAQWAGEAQAAFNAWVRARDAGQPCISCGRHHEGQYHAGHYLSRGARPEMAYEPLNVWLQCAPCNTYLSGNAVLFRKSLIEKIGIEKVEWLEGPHEPKRYTIDDLKAIKAEYTAKAKQLKVAA